MRSIVGVVLCCIAFGGASAQEGARSAQTSAQTEAYVPDLADIMAGTQLRHAKLSYAGNVENWPLAAYEIGQMTKSLDEAAKYYPDFKNVPVARLIGEISRPALADVGKSVEAKDREGFLKSFGRLTEACNACHKAAGFSFIRIQVPTASPFSNQTFTPAQ